MHGLRRKCCKTSLWIQSEGFLSHSPVWHLDTWSKTSFCFCFDCSIMSILSLPPNTDFFFYLTLLIYSLGWPFSNFLFLFLTMISTEQCSKVNFDNLAYCLPSYFTTVFFSWIFGGRYFSGFQCHLDSRRIPT